MTLLYLIRHGRSTWNAEGRIQGQADPPLDEAGRRQARALAAHLQGMPVHAFYSSPLARASETAEIVAAPHQLSVGFDERLMERHFGEWTGLTGAELETRIEAEPKRDWRMVGPPGGESRADLTARAAAVFAEIVAAYPVHTVAVVSHGGLLGAALNHLLGIPLHRPVSFHFENTSVARLRVNDRGVRLLAVGDDRHLG